MKGTITLLDRYGVQVSFEIEGETIRDFNLKKIIRQKELGEFGYTPVDIPAGGIVLPWANHDDFDWRAIGATPSIKTVYDQEGGKKEIPVVWYRNEMYTRRDMIGKTAPGGAKMPDMISYSRGARGTDEDAEKAVGGNDAGNKGYITLIAFRKMKGLPEDFKYPEFGKDYDETKVAGRKAYSQSAPPESAPIPNTSPTQGERRTYLQLKALLIKKLEAAGKEATDERINKNIIAKATKVLEREIDSPFKMSPADNYKVFIAFGGAPEDTSVPEQPKEEKAPAPKDPEQSEKPTAPAQAKAAAPKATAPAKAEPAKAATKAKAEPAKAPTPKAVAAPVIEEAPIVERDFNDDLFEDLEDIDDSDGIYEAPSRQVDLTAQFEEMERSKRQQAFEEEDRAEQESDESAFEEEDDDDLLS